MNWEAMFPGRFIKSAEFQGKDVTLTVKAVTLEDLPEDKGGTKRRGIIHFKETPKALVCNRTNATALKFMFGPETDNWVGKRVTLFAAPFTDPFTGEESTAVRVRGSPDLDGAKEFQARIGRKQARFRLVKTGPNPRKPAPAAAPKAPEPAPPAEPAGPDSFGGSDFPDPLTGEVPFGAEEQF